MTFEIAGSIFLSVLPALIPVLVISAVGLYYALSRKKLAPRAFGTAAWGFSLLIVQSLLGTAIRAVMTGIRTTVRNQGVAEAYFWPNILSAVSGLLFILGLALLARAVFLDRQPNQ